MIRSVSFIGAGNVATHLAEELFSKGIIINQVCSKKGISAKKLAKNVNAKSCFYHEINQTSDLYIVAVTDDELKKLEPNNFLKNKLVVHTSGNTPMDTLKPISDRIGVFYPLQTFSKDKTIDFENVPICIETNNDADNKILNTIGKLVSTNVQQISSEQRKKIHLAAVFACNFSNHFYSIAEEILQQNNLELSILYPLIEETAKKIQKVNPKEAQTGPAIRNDKKVIEEQLNQLKDLPEYQNLYKFVTQSIQRTHE